MTRGCITCHTRPLPFGGRHISYSWEGGDVITVSAELADDLFLADYPKEGGLFRLGPFWLRVLEYRFDRMEVLAIRERPMKARAYYLVYRATRLLDRVYRLFIITLYVWGLARYRREHTPTWRDIRGTDRLAAWVDRRRDAQLKRRIDRLNREFQDGQ